MELSMAAKLLVVTLIKMEMEISLLRPQRIILQFALKIYLLQLQTQQKKNNLLNFLVRIYGQVTDRIETLLLQLQLNQV